MSVTDEQLLRLLGLLKSWDKSAVLYNRQRYAGDAARKAGEKHKAFSLELRAAGQLNTCKTRREIAIGAILEIARSVSRQMPPDVLDSSAQPGADAPQPQETE